VPPFRAAEIVGACFAFVVSMAHVKDRLKQGDGVFKSGLRNRRQIAQILGKHLVSLGLQMRCFGATEELLTLTKQTRIDQCERVRVHLQTAAMDGRNLRFRNHH
jgi:hypothetical protein